MILLILRGQPPRITSGVQTRDYTYVDDMVTAFLNAAVIEKAIGEVIDVGSGEDLSVRDIVEKVRSLMNADIPLEIGAIETRQDEAWRLCCDNSKARELLNWQPKLTLEEGLQRTIQWFRENSSHCGNFRSDRYHEQRTLPR